MSYRTSKGFFNIAVSGQDTVSADEHTDTLTLAAGSNVTITTDASTDTITIAAASGGGGGGSSNTDTAVLNTRGYARVASSSNIYGHQWDGFSPPGQWTLSLGSAPSSSSSGDTLSLSVANGMAYMSVWVVPSACAVSKISASWYQSYVNARFRLRLWKCTPADNSSATQTWTAIGTGAVNANAVKNRTHLAAEDLTGDSYRTLNAGDLLGITFDGKNIDGSNYGHSNSNNRTTFQVAVELDLT